MDNSVVMGARGGGGEGSIMQINVNGKNTISFFKERINILHWVNEAKAFIRMSYSQAWETG